MIQNLSDWTSPIVASLALRSPNPLLVGATHAIEFLAAESLPTVESDVSKVRSPTATSFCARLHRSCIEVARTRARLLSGQTITVNVSGDTDVAGHTTLRDAITTADNDAGGDSIVFAPNLTGTITLSQGPLSITNSMTITGPGSGGSDNLRWCNTTYAFSISRPPDHQASRSSGSDAVEREIAPPAL